MDQDTNRLSTSELMECLEDALRAIEAGRTLTITRNGVAIAELRPVEPRRFVPRKVIEDGLRDAPRLDYARFRADLYGEPRS